MGFPHQSVNVAGPWQVLGEHQGITLSSPSSWAPFMLSGWKRFSCFLVFQLKIVFLTPERQVVDLIPLGRLIIIWDQAHYHCVISMLGCDIGLWGDYTLIGVMAVFWEELWIQVKWVPLRHEWEFLPVRSAVNCYGSSGSSLYAGI